MTNDLTPAERIADRKTAFTATATACRHAAAMGWAPNSEGELITGALDGSTWQCCALGAMALQHKLDSQVGEHTMPDLLNEVEDMGLAETLNGVPGIKDRSVASRSVARVFDRMANAYHRARFGLPMDIVDRRVLEQNGIADAEDFAHLSASDFWLLVAKRFEGLAQ
jgi:hypothetical protein